MKRIKTILAAIICLLPLLAHAEKALELWTFIDPAGDSPRSKALAQIIQTFEEKTPDVKIKPTVFAWNQINLAFCGNLRDDLAHTAIDRFLFFVPAERYFGR